MGILTRRSVLRASLGFAAAGALARPHIANAQAKTANVWWTQGFAHEEDIAFQKLVDGVVEGNFARVRGIGVVPKTELRTGKAEQGRDQRR